MTNQPDNDYNTFLALETSRARGKPVDLIAYQRAHSRLGRTQRALAYNKALRSLRKGLPV